jgi:hypothetical protein
MLEKTSFDLSLTDAANQARQLKPGQALVIIYDWYERASATRYFLAVRTGTGLTEVATYDRVLELDLPQARRITEEGYARWDHRGRIV